jgi:enamine deaminase RidA (YjgF/YER057c/UK114 family)
MLSLRTVNLLTGNHDMENTGSAVRPCEIRCHEGPLAKEMFVLCWPDAAETGIAAQTASVYRALYQAVTQEGGSPEHILQETVFFRDIRRDLGPSQKIRTQVMNPRTGRASYAPAATFIQQPPVNERRRIELLAYVFIPGSRSVEIRPVTALRLHQTGRVFLPGGHKHVFLANLCGSSGHSEEQAHSMFESAEKLLQKENMSFRDVVRTWIYLRHIVRDYAGLNRGRTKFFREQGLELPPASTGIGGVPPYPERNMCLSLYAIERSALEVQPMSAPTLNEAWMYGSDFSRGLNVAGTNGITLFISGTASVDEKGHTVHKGDFEEQAERMILNISTLLENQNASWRNVVSAITYLKSHSDAPALGKALTRNRIEGFPNALLQATVCRPDLLCEMEAIAILPPRQVKRDPSRVRSHRKTF